MFVELENVCALLGWLFPVLSILEIAEIMLFN